MSHSENKNDTVLLIEKVRRGEGAAFEQLLKRYEPLLEASVARFGRDELGAPHLDDLRQEATLVFYNAILNYDVENDGVEFGLYAKICIKNGLITATRALRKRIAEQPSDIALEDELLETEEPSARIIEEESLERIDRVIRESLSPLEYRVWCLYAAGKTAREIGACVGRSEKSVSNAIFRIRKKLRALLK